MTLRGPRIYALFIAVLLLLLLGINMLFNQQDAAQYDAGHQSMLAMDCESAVAQFDRVIHAFRLFDIGGYAKNARLENDQCERFLRGSQAEASGDFAAAALAYGELARAYPSSPLSPTVTERFTRILTSAPADNLATREWCDNYASLVASAGVSEADRNLVDGPIADSCGRMYQASGDLPAAARWYSAFLKDHPNHLQANELRAALSQVLIEEAASRQASSLEAPFYTGPGSGSDVVVTFYNNSPRKMRVIMTGPSTRIEDLAACPGCKPEAGAVSGACPKDGPSLKITTPPGDYQVLVDSAADNPAGEPPLLGAWSLPAGQYETCFFSVQP